MDFPITSGKTNVPPKGMPSHNEILRSIYDLRKSGEKGDVVALSYNKGGTIGVSLKNRSFFERIMDKVNGFFDNIRMNKWIKNNLPPVPPPKK